MAGRATKASSASWRCAPIRSAARWTSTGLASGAIDVVIDQNPDGEIAAALAVARALALGQDAERRPAPIEIGLYLRDNLPRG